MVEMWKGRRDEAGRMRDEGRERGLEEVGGVKCEVDVLEGRGARGKGRVEGVFLWRRALRNAAVRIYISASEL